MPTPFQSHFPRFDETWLSTAHQGPIPLRAAQAAEEAIRWKQQPWELTTDRFTNTPIHLRQALARLLGTTADRIVLANSASYGLHLLANGIPFQEGDEILVVQNDFPSDIYPWLGLQEQGVRIRFLKPEDNLPTPEELARAITPATRLFCTTWVHSFSGWTADLHGLGTICRDHDITFVVNGSQAVGARPVNVEHLPIDALLGVGFKWLCGPYGTGYLWLRPELLERLRINQTYWLSLQTADDLGAASERPELPKGPATVRRYDVFGTANFFNFKPWTASIETLLECGLDAIEAHDQALVERLLQGLDRGPWELTSPRSGPERSTLVLFRHRDHQRTEGLFRRLRAAGIHGAFRHGRIRLAPHLFNTEGEIDRALDALEGAG